MFKKYMIKMFSDGQTKFLKQKKLIGQDSNPGFLTEKIILKFN